MAMTRREAREAVLGLVFETDFHPEHTAEAIFGASTDVREIEPDDYVRTAYFGIMNNIEQIDGLIGVHSHGWKTHRMSGISRSAMRIAVWEMLYMKDIPHSVSINEAIELVKKYDDPKARTFVNGVLNAVKESLEMSNHPQKQDPTPEEGNQK